MFSKKETTYITLQAARNALHATTYASVMGKPFNWSLNINCTILGIPSDRVARRIGKQPGDWLGKRGEKMVAWLYVRENPKDNDNIHMALHVPMHLRKAFNKRQKGWVKKAAGISKSRRLPDRVLHNEPLGPKKTGITDEVDQGILREHIRRYVTYMLKGSYPEVCDELQRTHEPQGKVIGKRLGMSASIAAGAREAAGFNPKSYRVRQLSPFPTLLDDVYWQNWRPSEKTGAIVFSA
jgi:hypothetical protein